MGNESTERASQLKPLGNDVDLPTPELLGIETISTGWLNKYLLRYRLPNGEEIEYESVSRKGPVEYANSLKENSSGKAARPDAVCIVPVLPDDSILIIREFRYATNGWVISFPAGLIEEGESIRECIDRELLEETGHQVQKDFDGPAVTMLPQTGYSSVGMGDENVRIAVAHVEPVGDAQPEPNELIELCRLERKDVAEFLNKNQDLIGTRCQLLLELVKRTHAIKMRLDLALDPLTKEDFA